MMRSPPDLMFTANLNAFIALLTASVYLLSGLLDVPFSGIDVRLTMPLTLLAIILVAIWAKWGLAPPPHGARRRRLYFGAQLGMTLASIAFVAGIALCLHAATISHEDGYWCWILMLEYVGPVAGTLFLASAVLIFKSMAPKAIGKPFVKSR